MWIFLATEVLFFGGLLTAYAYGRIRWPEGFGLASRHTDVLIGTLNTGVLLTSSAVVALAVACAKSAAHRRWTGWLLYGAAALGVVFLGLKGLEYRQDWQEGLFPGSAFALAETAGAELFYMLYYLMTALHALHLTIGVGLLGVFGVGCRRRRPWANARRVDIAALYWHFVDIVWIVLYPLLYLVNRHA
jgi:cytochrome c oxidase subunit III